MRFTISAVAAVLAMASSVVAQTADFDPVTKPAKWEVIPAGSTYTIEWTAPAKYANEKIEISLIGGKTQDTQVPISTLTTGIMNSAGSYSWTVDSSLGADAVYGLVVKEVSNPSIFQYSNPFKISAASGKASGSATATATATASGSAGVTITTAVGVKTVTLECTTTTPNTTFHKVQSTHAPKNTTMAWTPPASKTPVATTPVPLPPSTAAPAPVPTETTAGASSVGASSLAFVGAVVMAYLAL